ncbi:Tenascin-R [Holothuria leucospilota]|uniref:Tenascin-R n=1 Tax=Holothuria leucospilota TaxID=206669 RepID=A0A9Q1BZU2_HOLLE|nr:Tenascin-R [Holothuria leucospilota]
MSDHRGRAFSTPDRDNNGNNNHCGLFYSAGWWYKGCYTANLNGGAYGGDRFALFNRDTETHYRNLRYSQMKIRPI